MRYLKYGAMALGLVIVLGVLRWNKGASGGPMSNVNQPGSGNE